MTSAGTAFAVAAIATAMGCGGTHKTSLQPQSNQRAQAITAAIPDAEQCPDPPSDLTLENTGEWSTICIAAAVRAEQALNIATQRSRDAKDAILLGCIESKRNSVESLREVLQGDASLLGPANLDVVAAMVTTRHSRIARLVAEAQQCI